MMRKLLALLITGTCGVANLNAQVSFVSNRSALSGPTLDWISMYGLTFTPIPTAFVATGVPGLTLSSTVTPYGTLAFTSQQTINFAGNFLSNESILEVIDPPIVFTFNTDIFGFGTQVQSGNYGPFLGSITAYDGVGASLGSFAFSGNSTNANDGSAVFVGIESLTGMRSVGVFVQQTQVMALNDPTIELMPSAVTTEPPAMALLASGIVTLGTISKRRKRRTC